MNASITAVTILNEGKTQVAVEKTLTLVCKKSIQTLLRPKEPV